MNARQWVQHAWTRRVGGWPIVGCDALTVPVDDLQALLDRCAYLEGLSGAMENRVKVTVETIEQGLVGHEDAAQPDVAQPSEHSWRYVGNEFSRELSRPGNLARFHDWRCDVCNVAGDDAASIQPCTRLPRSPA